MTKPEKPGRVALSLARILNSTSVVCFRLTNNPKMVGPSIKIVHKSLGVETVWTSTRGETSVVESNGKKYLVGTVQCRSISRFEALVDIESPESLEVTVTNSDGDTSDVNSGEDAVVFP
jgi:hypothetical protein